MRHLINLLIGLLVVGAVAGFLYFHWPWYSILPIAFVGVFLNYLADQIATKAQLRRAERKTSARPSQPLASHFPSELAAIAQNVECKFADVQGVDWSRVDPDDHLIEELGLNEADIMFCLHGLHAQYQIEIPRNATHTLNTLRKIVSWVHNETHTA